MVDKGFRRIAFTLIGISIITAITAGIYLYFNFNAKSRLPLVVPNSATWFMQLRTKEIKENVQTQIPQNYVSLIDSIRFAPAFKYLKDPGPTGLSLLSDVVLFQTARATFFALSVSNENRFSTFLDTEKLMGYMHGKVIKPNYTYAQVVGKPWYVVYKLKAMVIMQPINAMAEPAEIESMIEEVFNGKPSHFLENKLIQELYDRDCQVIIWSKNQGKSAACGYVLSDNNLNVYKVGDFQRSNAYSTWQLPDNLRLGWHALSSANQLTANDIQQSIYKNVKSQNLNTTQFTLEFLFSQVLSWRSDDLKPAMPVNCVSHE